jgi:hypothetical protein
MKEMVNMMYYIEQLKNWKELSKYKKQDLKIGLLRNAVLLLVGLVLYLLLNDTGLLLYIILMLKIHWSWESE